MFQRAVKTKLGRDKSSSSEESPVCTTDEQTPRLSEDVGSEKFTPPPLYDPPRLEVLSELPHINNLQRSSTFRTYLEKAATDINNKYGSVQSLPEARRVRRRPSWRKTLPSNSRVVVPIPPRSYFRPRDDGDSLSKPPLTGAKYLNDGVINTHPRHHKTSNRIPATQVDKILEESLSLRDPPEIDCYPESIPMHEHDPDRHLVPLLYDCEISKDENNAPTTCGQKIDARGGALVCRPPSSTFGAHSSLVETINDFQNPESSFRSRNPSGSSWITVQFSKEDLDLLAQLEKGRCQDTCAHPNAELKAEPEETSSSLEVCYGSGPETPRVQAMLMVNSPDTFHLPPAALDHGLKSKKDGFRDEQMSQDEALTHVGSWAEACTPKNKCSRSSSNLQNPIPENKPSVVTRYCGSNSLEDLLEVQSFVASRRRLFESSVSSPSDDDDVSADESGVSLDVADNLKMGELRAPNSQNLGNLNYVG